MSLSIFCLTSCHRDYGKIGTETPFSEETSNGDDEEDENEDETSSSGIEQLAASDDYDAMIDKLEEAVQECEDVKDEYFNGNLADKVAKRKIETIENKYKAIQDKLNKADEAGELNYNQHKRLTDVCLQLSDVAIDAAGTYMNDLDESVHDHEIGDVIDAASDDE